MVYESIVESEESASPAGNVSPTVVCRPVSAIWSTVQPCSVRDFSSRFSDTVELLRRITLESETSRNLLLHTWTVNENSQLPFCSLLPWTSSSLSSPRIANAIQEK